MNAEDQSANSPNQPQSGSGPESLCLSRCAGCYRQVGSVHWRGGDGESSSSAEDSGPEVDWDSETESSSSSCCSVEAPSEISEEPETEKLSSASGDAAEPESGGKDGDKLGETGETSESQADTSRAKGVTLRAPLVKSFSLPASFTPHLIPLSMLPRPHTAVSTLHLQVLSQKHNADISYILKRDLSEREDETTGGRGGVNNLLPLQMGLPWQQGLQPTLQQHQLSYHYHHHQQQQQQHHQQLLHQHQQEQQQQQNHHQLLHQHQQPQHFPLLSAQGQRLPSPTHTLSVSHPPTHHTPLQVPNSPQTHLHAPTPQTCWCCYSMPVPYSANCSPYCSGQLPR